MSDARLRDLERAYRAMDIGPWLLGERDPVRDRIDRRGGRSRAGQDMSAEEASQ